MNTSFKAVSRVAVAGALLAVAGTSARADLGLTGAVGLPLNPTAQIPLPGGVRLQADYFDLGNINNSGGGASIDLSDKFYGVHAAGRVGDQVEVNGGISSLRSRLTTNNGAGLITSQSDNRTGLDIGAKYLFSRESDPVGVRLAAGAGYSRALADNINVYVVGTKYFGELTGERVPVIGHLGLRYDRFRLGNLVAGGGGGGSDSRLSIFAGVELPIIRNGSLQFVGEIQSKNVSGGSSPYSASLRYRPKSQPYSASVGIQRQGLFNDNGLFVQLGYSFDTNKGDDSIATP